MAARRGGASIPIVAPVRRLYLNSSVFCGFQACPSTL